jgi:S-(hydroxymethyl)glutathione synthase
MAVKLHPSIDKGVKAGAKKFKGGTLTCHCATEPVTVSIKGNVAHNHACGCTKCWKPAGAKVSVVAVVGKENVAVTANEQKLGVVDASATIQRHACNACGVHMYGRIENAAHAFYGLDFVHVELSKDKGWAKPEFAAFVSSIIEAGAAKPKEMTKIRDRFKKLRLPPYDCLSPALMDVLATHAAKQKGTLKA